ncbi:MAG TPA: CpsB/CapC family capsule biosynthesis tyrosine phosphatase [Clostridia bacterium]
MLMDLHNHTIESDGENTAEQLITNAIANNIACIGITDHFYTSKCSSVSSFMLEEYISGLCELKEKYKDKIKVLCGVEICMIHTLCYLENLPYEKLNMLDFVLFEYVDKAGAVALPEISEYAGRLTCHKGLAHTNLMGIAEKYGLDNTIKMLKENNLFWELNTSYEYFDLIMNNIDKHFIRYFLGQVNRNGILLTAGSDTHNLVDFDIEKLKAANQLVNDYCKIQNPFA